MKKLILSILLLCIYSINYAQNIDIRFKRDSVNCEIGSVCYVTQIKPNGTMPINLGGQNYRIFYNSSLAKTTSVVSLLPSQYGALSLVQDLKDVDASSVGGPLSFEATLGFLNYAIDLSDVQNGGVEITMEEWYPTTRICFNVEPEVFENPELCLEAVWGRDGVTDLYATAFMEVSRWVMPNRTTATLIVNHIDLNASSGDEACFTETCGSFSNAEIYIDDVLISENNGSVNVQLCLNETTTDDVTVTVKTTNGTALADLDYVAIPETTYTIPAGQTCVAINIEILDDDVYEGDESFNVELSNPSANAEIVKAIAIVTIDDNESIPQISIEDKTVNEDDGSISMTVSLSGKIAVPVTFNVNTIDGTAKSDDDYIAIVDQSYTIPAEALSANITLNIIDDDYAEANETFSVAISNVSSGVTIEKGTGIITIVDNDVRPSLSINDPIVMEQVGIAYVVVTLSSASNQNTEFKVNTADGTALEGIDYIGIEDETYTILAGQTFINIPVAIIDDNIVEPAKTFEIIVSNASAHIEIDKGVSVITILDDDESCAAKAPVLRKN